MKTFIFLLFTASAAVAGAGYLSEKTGFSLADFLVVAGWFLTLIFFLGKGPDDSQCHENKVQAGDIPTLL